jgi:hypothetical protein
VGSLLKEIAVEWEKLGEWELSLDEAWALLQKDKANWESEKAGLIKQIHADEQKKMSVQFLSENPGMQFQFLVTDYNEAVYQYNAHISVLEKQIEAANKLDMQEYGYTGEI